MTLAGGSTMIVGTILLGSSNTVAQFLVGRIVTGLGNGFNSSTVPMYQSEMAKPEKRGMLLTAQGTVTIVGLCIAYVRPLSHVQTLREGADFDLAYRYWLDYGMSTVDSSAQWR